MTISVGQKFTRYETGAVKGGFYAIVGIATGNHSIEVATVEWAAASESTPVETVKAGQPRKESKP